MDAEEFRTFDRRIVWSAIAIAVGLIVLIWLAAIAGADFGVEGEAGADDDHLDTPRRVRLATNGSMLVVDRQRITYIDENAHTMKWGLFGDADLIPGGWVAVNDTTMVFSDGRIHLLDNASTRVASTGSGYVVGGTAFISTIDGGGVETASCPLTYYQFVDVYPPNYYSHHDKIYAMNFTTCASTVVYTNPDGAIYSFHPVNGTYAVSGWANNSFYVRLGNWSTTSAYRTDDLSWNGYVLAGTEGNGHIIRTWSFNEYPDGDGDGVIDPEDDCPVTWGNSTIDRTGCPDRDGDGWSDDGDAFPDDPTEWSDDDGDGVGDNADHCPDEWGNATDLRGCPDTDGDGIADTNDPCPLDELDGCVDLDGDGYNATVDACPTIWGNSTVDRLGCPDRDGDGTSDLNDPCPDDPLDLCGDPDGDSHYGSDDDCPTTWGNSTIDQVGCPDTDGDGYSDGGDAFPNDPTEWEDPDGDGVGSNTDVCPTTWGNSTSPPGCPDRDGDGLADLVDPCPDDPTNTCNDPPPELEFTGVTGIPANRSYLLEFMVYSNECYVEWGTSWTIVYSTEIGPSHWFYQYNFTDLLPNTTYTFQMRCVSIFDPGVEGWLNHTGTTLADPDDPGDGGGDGDGNTTPEGGDGDEDQPPGLLEATPGGLPISVIALSMVALVGLSLAIMMNVKPQDPLVPPGADPFLRTEELEELEAIDNGPADYTEPFASPDLFDDIAKQPARAPALPLVPVPGKEFLPEAPTPSPDRMPYLAIQVAEAEDLPGILANLEGQLAPRICEENKQVLTDVKDLEKRLRQLRDDRDIAPRKYEKLLRDVEELKRAVQQLTPLMERRDWDV